MTFLPKQAPSMSSGLLLDTLPSSSESDSSIGAPRFRPYTTPNQHVTKGRYITSNDPRGYIPVYEYPLNGQWIMLDMDDGYVLWTGIWKALGNSKADIVKMIESQPDLASKLRRVRGGYLKIQGTWMPYETALRLARRVAWPIRHELIPLFGPTFPSTCLSPDQPGYGQVVNPGSGRRKARRTYAPPASTDSQQDWNIVSSSTAQQPFSNISGPSFAYQSRRAATQAQEHTLPQTNESPIQLHQPYASHQPSFALSSPTGYGAGPSRSSQPSPVPIARARYSPYQNTVHPTSASAASPSSYTSTQDGGQSIRLAPIREPNDSHFEGRNNKVSLPPISTLDGFCQGLCEDSAAVLRRLKTPEDQCLHPDLSLLPRDTTHDNGPGIPPIHHQRYPNITTRLSPVHPSPATAFALGDHYHRDPRSSASSPYLSPATPNAHQGGESTINSPSSVSIATPLSARASLDDTRAGGYHSPVSIASAEERLLPTFEYRLKYRQ